MERLQATEGLRNKVRNRGSEDCDHNQDPPIEVFESDATTYILRQNTFMHVLPFGLNHI